MIVIRKRIFKFYVAVFTLSLVLSIFLVACNLNRAPIVWITDVTPQFVCPGDSVTLSWDANEPGCLGDGCPPPVVVSISSNPIEVLASPLSGLRGSGELVVGPITSPTNFTFSATGGTDPRTAAIHNVDVVLPERETAVPLDFAPVCTGAGVTWEGADLSIPNFRSFGVHLVRVCNTSAERVMLNLYFGSDVQTWSLLPGQCTPDLPPELGRLVTGAYAFPLIPSSPPGTSCDVSLSLPSPIDMVAILGCDVMSASEPIVAASPEETQSGIISLWTETPATTEFILNIEVPANCRQGPGTVYPVVNSAQQGQQVQVLGKNADNTWWYSQLANDKCWISNVAGIPSGDINQLQIIPAPPTPAPTATEQTDQESTEESEIDFDQDGYGVSVDCDDKNSAIHPNATEIPDDKVDSNCNGDDDK